MSNFEDHLWREVVREHGDGLAQVSRPAARNNRRARPKLVVGAGLALAGAGAVLALVLGATTTSPAFAVTRNHDGTVTVSVNGYGGIAGANAKLHQLGIRAEVMTQMPSGCAVMRGSPAPSPGIADAHWTISPGKIPAGRTLVLAPAAEANGGNSGSGGQIWSCPTGPVGGAPSPGAS